MSQITKPIAPPIVSPKEYIGLTADAIDAREYVYTPIEQVMTELRKRRKNTALEERIKSNHYFKPFPPLEKSKRPRALLFRQLATPTHEVIRFLRLAKKLNLKPLIFEYHDDKFVSSGNVYKRLLGKMPIYQFTGSDGRDAVKYQTVIDFNKWTGKKIKNIVCKNGESLIEFHHRLLARIARINPKTICADATEWLHSYGSAKEYYKSFFTLFLRDAILFETWEPRKEEETFFQSIVLPAFHSVRMVYGFRPLIIRLAPEKEETRLFWDSYPKKTESLF